MRGIDVVVCCLLLAGGITAQQNVTATAGEQIIFNVFEWSNTVVSCHLTYPDGKTLDFVHGQISEHERFELQPANPNYPTCSVIVKDLKESDTGVWKLTLKNDAGAETSQTFNLNVLPNPEETFLESLDVKWLNPIEYPTVRGERVDVSLSKQAYPEECYIISPGKQEFIEKDIEGVTFQDSSYFVSCRVTLGPLDEEMLGHWALCGKRTDNNDEKDRCQLVTISWYRSNNPDSEWGAVIQSRFNHVVNYGSTLSPVVQGSGTRVSCHIITPAGEDLVLDMNSNYPNLRLRLSDTSICTVDLEIDAHMLGEWTLYGKFRDFLGIHEIRLPMNLFLYDENNPYVQAYNVTIKDPVKRGIEIGSTVDMSVLGNGRLDSCQVETPSGEKLYQDSLKYEGVAFESDEESVACLVTLGPLTEQLLGNWTLIGKFSNGGRFTEERQTFEIVRAEDLIELIVRDPVQVAVNLGTLLNMDVTSAGKVDGCMVVTPSGEMYDPETLNDSGVEFADMNNANGCRVILGPITEQLLGNWTIIGRFSNGDLFTEEHKTYTVHKEDPSNPMEEDRIVFDLREQQVTTGIGSQHRLTISTTYDIVGQSCHIRTPAGLQYQIMDGFNFPGVELISQIGVECGVIIHVLTEEAIGTWTLIARAIQRTELIERRLPFTINVEDTVDAIPKKVTIFEGNDLYVRLANPTEEHDTCKLTGPTDTVSTHVVDPLQVKSCGYIIMNVTSADTGTWEITYGSKTLYIANVDVSVSVESSIDTDFKTTIELTLGQSVSMTVGPLSAVYCRLEDLFGERTIFEGFGNCRLDIASVTARHHGPLAMLVTTAGRVVAVQHQLFINVTGTELKPIVMTNVTQAKPVITVSCSVTTDAEAHGCKFRNPHGKVMLAVSTMAEDRYVTSFHSEESNHECSLQITNPLTSDLGNWRCAIETEKETYYGFMDVLCPFAMQDPAVAATVEHEPILRSDRSIVEDLEGSSVTLSCSINAAIKYCYFRASNGTTFAVSPGMKSASMEYFGAGFEAGECGVTIHDIKLGDQGEWSCHVSLFEDYREQRDLIKLQVYDEMTARQYYDYGSNLVVEGVVYMSRVLEYCRYVRIDGHGFDPKGETDVRYQEVGDLKNGVCRLVISRPTILDHHPWTVAARVIGQPLEISRTTNSTLSVAPGGIDDGFVPRGSSNGVQILLFIMICSVFVTLILGALGPKKNREWTYSRASIMRQSLRNSFRKKPLPADPIVHTEATSTSTSSV